MSQTDFEFKLLTQPGNVNQHNTEVLYSLGEIICTHQHNDGILKKALMQGMPK